ncbi:MAG TPA: AAA family ATPase, partial [Candidatus Methanomethylicus sp.]|nr:AAA family ATPase [Candidatus Methanomethylicus sp.]
LVEAKEGFTIIATQNPEEYIGTSRLSEALKDRFVWIRLDYQSESEEEAIVKKETRSDDELLVKIAVNVGRATRQNAEMRRGASVRGAIDIVSIMQQASPCRLADMVPEDAVRLLKEAVVMALSSKVELREGSHEKLIEVLSKIVDAALNELGQKVPAPRVTKEHSENF